jgi:folate-binding protein YgfZ
MVFAGRRGLSRVWEWLRPHGDAPDGSAPRPPDSLGELSPTALHRARLAAGVPAIPGEFGPQDLPQEAGLETVAISFNKGCYLGQEVMARLHAMGQVRRRLLRVGGIGPAPAANVEIRQNDKRVGELRAVTDDGRDGWLGLALLNLLGLDSSASLVTADNHTVHTLDPIPS